MYPRNPLPGEDDATKVGYVVVVDVAREVDVRSRGVWGSIVVVGSRSGIGGAAIRGGPPDGRGGRAAGRAAGCSGHH